MKILLLFLSIDLLGSESWLLAGAIGAIVFILFMWFFSGRCPSCKKYRAAKIKETSLINTFREYEDRVREDPIYNNNNEQIGHTKRTEQVLVTYKKYRDDCFCKYCNHTWSETYTT